MVRKIPEDMIPGTVHDTKYNGKLKVIAYHSGNRVDIMFIETGYQRTTKSSHIRSGLNIKDPTRPTVYGVGYIGDGKYRAKANGQHTPPYLKWHAMMQRCYCENYLAKKPSYNECRVDCRWHDYQVFAKWFYDNHPDPYGETDVKYHLDKDLSQYGDNGKIYSPETCVFVTAQVNVEEAHAKHYKLRSPEGLVVDIYNLSKFCREHGLKAPEVYKVFYGVYKSHHGWSLP